MKKLNSNSNYFEVLFYVGETAQIAVQSDFVAKKFESKKDAFDFYEKHKKDTDKHLFWVTERSLNGHVIADFVW